jgi:hypothetical protein
MRQEDEMGWGGEKGVVVFEGGIWSRGLPCGLHDLRTAFFFLAARR